MVTFIIALISLILVIGIYYIIKRIRRNSALKILLRHSQKLADKTLIATLTDTNETYDTVFEAGQDLISEPVQDIWGKGIMVFEYKIAIQAPQKHPEAFFDKAYMQHLESLLNTHAAENGIVASSPKYPPFILSDYWILKGYFHADIAFMTNKPTIEYVKDMRKADLEKTQ